MVWGTVRVYAICMQGDFAGKVLPTTKVKKSSNTIPYKDPCPSKKSYYLYCLVLRQYFTMAVHVQ
jgi:hypothetical protein